VKRNRALAFTRLDLLLIIGVVTFFAIVVGSYFLSKAKNRALRISCVNNVKQCALATLVWSGDNQDKFPMEVSNTLGGTLDWVAGGNAFRHFQVMSNELSTPQIVWCPADPRKRATNFTADFKNENVSFFVGLDAKKSNPQKWLYGERNITNGITLDHTIMTLTSGKAVGWNRELHDRRGNLAMADGSVKMLSNDGLLEKLKQTAGETNRLALPE
jgi:prepilin-type processing-associated H-X9-DG protein